MRDRFFHLFRQFRSRYGNDRTFLPAILCVFRRQLPQHHLRIVNKIAVDGQPVRRLPEVYPVRFNVDRVIPLLQENDIRHDIRPGIGTESIVRQPDRSEKFRPLSQVFPHFRRLLVHGVPACDKGHNAARTHLIQCFGKEIVVDGESQPVIGLVTDLIVAEWDIAHGKVIEIPAVCGLKTGNRNLCLRIQFLRDTACDGVQLHTVQAAVLHILRQHPE